MKKGIPEERLTAVFRLSFMYNNINLKSNHSLLNSFTGSILWSSYFTFYCSNWCLAQRVEHTETTKQTIPADGLNHIRICLLVGSVKSHQVALLVPNRIGTGYSSTCHCGNILAHKILVVESSKFLYILTVRIVFTINIDIICRICSV